MTKESSESKQRSALGSEMVWTTASINDAVRFKLTPKGRSYITELNRTHPIYSRFPLEFLPDPEGWIETQLWRFVNVFGPTMGPSFDQPVEANIQLRPYYSNSPMSDDPKHDKEGVDVEVGLTKSGRVYLGIVDGSSIRLNEEKAKKLHQLLGQRISDLWPNAKAQP